MKLYNSIGPNPRLVRMFAAAKGISLPIEEVDVMAGDNRKPAFLSINPAGQLPVLILDNGMALAETVAICEYLEERHPTPPLIGSTAEERALTRMWTRRVEQAVVQPMTHGFRGAEGLPMFKDRVHCLPQAADDLKATAQEGLAWLEGLIGDRPFLAGDRVTLADIVLFSFLHFGAKVGQTLAPANERLTRWYGRMAALPAAVATDW